MTKKISALTARTQFGQIMSVDDYLKTIAPEDTALQKIRDESKGAGLDVLTMEAIDAEVAAYRREKRAKSGSC